MPLTIHTATLKYKNSQGQYQSADCLKGDPGVPGANLVESITSSAATINGQPNVRYVCGEIGMLTINPPSLGSVEVIFTSGATPTLLTVPNTVKFPPWFDATSLAANTIYDIIITDGVYGAVMSWAS